MFLRGQTTVLFQSWWKIVDEKGKEFVKDARDKSILTNPNSPKKLRFLLGPSRPCVEKNGSLSRKAIVPC